MDNGKRSNIKNENSSSPARKISKDDAKNNRYPNSTEPGVHSDSAPIGGA